MPRSNGQSQPADRAITIPQSELSRLPDHAALTICRFIHVAIWSMIHIIQRGKR
jgi:hypothetical protein